MSCLVTFYAKLNSIITLHLKSLIVILKWSIIFRISEKYWHQQIIFWEQSISTFVVGMGFILVSHLHHKIYYPVLSLTLNSLLQHMYMCYSSRIQYGKISKKCVWKHIFMCRSTLPVGFGKKHLWTFLALKISCFKNNICILFEFNCT